MVVDYLSSQPNRAGYQVSTKQGSGPITHVITHTTRTNSETISGKRDVTDQPVLVTAGNDHAGDELREIGETHGLRGSSEGGLHCGLSRSDARA